MNSETSFLLRTCTRCCLCANSSNQDWLILVGKDRAPNRIQSVFLDFLDTRTSIEDYPGTVSFLEENNKEKKGKKKERTCRMLSRVSDVT